MEPFTDYSSTLSTYNILSSAINLLQHFRATTNKYTFMFFHLVSSVYLSVAPGYRLTSFKFWLISSGCHPFGTWATS